MKTPTITFRFVVRIVFMVDRHVWLASVVIKSHVGGLLKSFERKAASWDCIFSTGTGWCALMCYLLPKI